jgi:DNA polymerase-3 subunit gamma/tau
MVIAMNLQSLTRELANNCIFEAIDEHECRLILAPKHAHMSGSRAEEKLQLALQKYYGKALRLVIKREAIATDTPAIKIQQEKLNRQQDAVNSIENDENIQALKTNFDARVIPGSIEPVENIIEEK